MRLLLALTVLLGLFASGVAEAQSKTARYLAKHPLPPKEGGGFCYIDAPHIHAFSPPDTRLYRLVDDEYYFVGDPVPFGYEGTTHGYYGPHPIIEIHVHIHVRAPIYCYLDGPHYHASEPPESAPFEEKGGAYWYVGTFEPSFQKERPRYVAVNEVYKPLVYERPKVDITVAPATFKVDVKLGIATLRLEPAPRTEVREVVYVKEGIRYDPHEDCHGHDHHHGHGKHKKYKKHKHKHGHCDHVH